MKQMINVKAKGMMSQNTMFFQLVKHIEVSYTILEDITLIFINLITKHTIFLMYICY